MRDIPLKQPEILQITTIDDDLRAAPDEVVSGKRLVTRINSKGVAGVS